MKQGTQNKQTELAEHTELAYQARQQTQYPMNGKPLVIEEQTQQVVFGNFSSIRVNKGAKLWHYHIVGSSGKGDNYPADCKMAVQVEERAEYNSLVLLQGSKDDTLSICDITVNLLGQFSKANSNAIYLLSDRQRAELYLKVQHTASNTVSNQISKGLMGGASFLDFKGLIDIVENVNKIDGNQLNNAIILSDMARLNVSPELAILSEDVKCTHGASLGELDDEALFYMTTRGIPYDTAKHLLLTSFLHTLTQDIKTEDVQKGFMLRINQWLLQNLK